MMVASYIHLLQYFYYEYCVMHIFTVNMLGRGSPRLTMLLSKAAQKKNSPKGCHTKKHGGSLRDMQLENIVLVVSFSCFQISMFLLLMAQLNQNILQLILAKLSDSLMHIGCNIFV